MQSTEQTSKKTKKPSLFPYYVAHQKLAIIVDLVDETIAGYTDIHFVCNGELVPQLRLHCHPQIHVSSVAYVKTQDLTDSMDVEGLYEPPKLQAQRIKPIDIDDNEKNLKNLTANLKAEQDLQDLGSLVITLDRPMTKGEKRVIRVYYEIENCQAGIYFVKVQDNPSYMYTNNLNGARLWFPCLDLLSAVSTFEFQITTHLDAVVVCTGDLIKQEVSDTLKTSFFEQKKKSIVPRTIGLCAGFFKVLPDPQLPFVTYFHLPHHSTKKILHTIQYMPKTFQFIEEFLGVKYVDYFGCYKQVYLDHVHSKTCSFATMSILSAEMLLDEKVIEGTMSTRVKMATMIARQFFGNYIQPKTWPDLWITMGMSGYVGLQFMQREFGRNELRCHVYKQAKKVRKLDTHIQPLYCENFVNPAELFTPLLTKKSALIVYMIERMINTSNMKKLLNKMLVDAALEVASSNKQKTPRSTSTKTLLKNIKKAYAIELKQFAEYWVYSTGVPELHCGFSFDAGRSVVEFVVKQICEGAPTMKFGNLPVRVHETEGTYDYLIPVNDEHVYFEFPCRSKPRKKQRKKMMEEQNKELPRIEIPVRWMRMDADLEVAKVIKYKQTEAMWINQFESDRDVIAHLEALEALSLFNNSERALKVLRDTLMLDEAVYYRVRQAAAKSLTRYYNPIAKSFEYELVLTFFKKKFYDVRMVYVKPNDFSNIGDYYVKKKIPIYLSLVRNEKGNSPNDIVDFILSLIKYNDDSSNEFSGAYYVGSLIKALGFLKTDKVDKILKILKRSLVMDSLLPSHHQVLTNESLLSFAEMQSKGRIAVDLPLFWDYFKSMNNIYYVRRAALQGLFKVLTSQNLSSPVQFDDIFIQLWDIIESPNETSKTKHMILQLIHFYVLIAIQQLRQIHAKFDKVASPLAEKILKLRGSEKENRAFVDRLWNLILTTDADFRLRSDLMKIYFAIYGGVTPNCYRTSDFVNTYILDEVPREVKMELSAPAPVIAPTNYTPSSSRPTEVISLDQTPPPTAPPKPKKKVVKRPLENGETPAPKKVKVAAPPPIQIIKTEQPVTDPSATATGEVTPASSKLSIKLKVNTAVATAHPPPKPKQKTKAKASKKKQAADDDDDDDDDVDEELDVFNLPTETVEVSKPKVTTEMRNEMSKQKQEADADSKELEAITKQNIMDAGLEDRTMMIYFPDQNIRLYCRLYYTKLASYIFKTLPIDSPHANDDTPGLVWFNIPQIDPSLEITGHFRDLVCKNEIAYWKEGNAVVLAQGKTPYSWQSETRLAAKCLFFGTFLYDYKKLGGLKGEVKLERPRRIVLTVPGTTYSLDMDLYVNDAANYVYDTILQPVRTSTMFFGKMFYFGIGKQQKIIPPPDKHTAEILYRDYMNYGEIAYWCDSASNIGHILVGTGVTNPHEPVTKKNANLIKLIEKCYVIGRVASRKALKVYDTYLKSPTQADPSIIPTPVVIQRRQIHVTLEAGDTSLSYIGYFYDTVTSDILFKLLPLKGLTCTFINPSSGMNQLSTPSLASKLPTHPNQIIEKEATSDDDMKITAGELAFDVETKSIIIIFAKGSTDKVEEKYPSYNAFGKLDTFLLPDSIYSASNITITLQSLADVSQFSEDVTMSQGPVAT